MLCAKSLLTTIAGRARFDFEIMRNKITKNTWLKDFNKRVSAFLKN